MDKSIVPNNQIATSSSEVVEIEDKDISVERHMEDLNYQFNEKNVPEILKTLINGRSGILQEIWVDLNGQECKMQFEKSIIRMERKEDYWLINYGNISEKIKCEDHEKFIIDNLWFVLKNPNLTLNCFILEAQYYPKSEENNSMETDDDCSPKMDAKKFILLLQSMLDSIDHQIQSYMFICIRFDEDTLLSLLKYFKAGILESIDFEMSWKEDGNYQKMKEIVETDQWKQAKSISSLGVARLEIKDFAHCEVFRLGFESITPEDVLPVIEQVFNFTGNKCCVLCCETENYDIDAILHAIRSQNDGSKITKFRAFEHLPGDKCCYKIAKSAKRVFLTLNGNDIVIQNY